MTGMFQRRAGIIVGLLLMTSAFFFALNPAAVSSETQQDYVVAKDMAVAYNEPAMIFTEGNVEIYGTVLGASDIEFHADRDIIISGSLTGIGSISLSAGRNIVITGSIVGQAEKLAIHASEKLLVEGQITTETNTATDEDPGFLGSNQQGPVQGADGPKIDLSGTIVEISGTVIAGDGGHGSDGIHDEFALGGEGGKGGSVTVSATLDIVVTSTGILAAGRGGFGGGAIGPAAFGGAAGDSGDLILESVREIESKGSLVGGVGGN